MNKQQLNTKYNALFYADKYLDEGIKKIEKLHKDDYKKILEINTHFEPCLLKKERSNTFDIRGTRLIPIDNAN